MVGSLDLRVSPGGKVNDLVGHGAGQAAVLPHCNSQTLSKIDQLLSSKCTYVQDSRNSCSGYGSVSK